MDCDGQTALHHAAAAGHEEDSRHSAMPDFSWVQKEQKKKTQWYQLQEKTRIAYKMPGFTSLAFRQQPWSFILLFGSWIVLNLELPFSLHDIGTAMTANSSTNNFVEHSSDYMQQVNSISTQPVSIQNSKGKAAFAVFAANSIELVCFYRGSWWFHWPSGLSPRCAGVVLRFVQLSWNIPNSQSATRWTVSDEWPCTTQPVVGTRRPYSLEFVLGG